MESKIKPRGGFPPIIKAKGGAKTTKKTGTVN